MNKNYFFISLICIIFLNCFLYLEQRLFVKREGFDIGKIGKEISKITDFIKNFNPAELIEKALGGIIDSLLGGVPILKDIHKKVKKKKGLLDKIGTTFFELFISLLTIIFLPLGAIACLYLAYQLFLMMMANIPVLFQPNSLLKYIC